MSGKAAICRHSPQNYPGFLLPQIWHREGLRVHFVNAKGILQGPLPRCIAVLYFYAVGADIRVSPASTNV